MHIEIVSHCFNPVGTDIYAQMLKWQLASLVNYTPKCEVTMSVFTLEDDISTLVCYDLIPLCPENVTIYVHPLPPEYLFRRAIGRNMRAKKTKADVIWFTDVDYIFGDGCIDSVMEQVNADSELRFPMMTQINGFEGMESRQGHALGTKMIDIAREEILPKINPKLFIDKPERRAIGGIQILGGNVSRRVGYLDGTKWVQPVNAEHGFRSCKCDFAFRKHNKFDTQKIDVPNLFRIRHEIDGRDYDLQGTVKGKEVW